MNELGVGSNVTTHDRMSGWVQHSDVVVWVYLKIIPKQKIV